MQVEEVALHLVGQRAATLLADAPLAAQLAALETALATKIAFGAAKLLGRDDEVHLTRQVGGAMSPDYAAPEQILDALSGLEGLRVPGRASSFYFKGKGATPEEVARRLGAALSSLEGP